MRKIISVLLAGVVVLALSACGDSDNKTAASSSTTDSSTLSSSTSDKEVSGDFCTEIQNVDPVEIANDPTGAKEAAATLKQLDPPSEIADEWDDYIEGIEEIANTSQSDTAKLAQIAQEHLSSFTAVGLYIAQSCVNAFSGSIPSIPQQN